MKTTEIAQNVDAIVHANFPPYESGTLENLDEVISSLIDLKIELEEKNAKNANKEQTEFSF